MNTTNTNEPIEPKERRKGTLFVADLEMRDYFAAKAMQGLLIGIESGKEHQAALIPKIAYDMADVMLRVREAT